MPLWVAGLSEPRTLQRGLEPTTDTQTSRTFCGAKNAEHEKAHAVLEKAKLLSGGSSEPWCIWRAWTEAALGGWKCSLS